MNASPTATIADFTVTAADDEFPLNLVTEAFDNGSPAPSPSKAQKAELRQQQAAAASNRAFDATAKGTQGRPAAGKAQVKPRASRGKGKGSKSATGEHPASASSTPKRQPSNQRGGSVTPSPAASRKADVAPDLRGLTRQLELVKADLAKARSGREVLVEELRAAKELAAKEVDERQRTRTECNLLESELDEALDQLRVARQERDVALSDADAADKELAASLGQGLPLPDVSADLDHANKVIARLSRTIAAAASHARDVELILSAGCE